MREVLKQGGELAVALDATADAEYDNLHVAYWEPLLEPWTVSLALLQSPREVDVKVSSKAVMNLNVSHAVLQNVVGSLNGSFVAAAAGAPQSPFAIRNFTGSDLRCR